MKAIEEQWTEELGKNMERGLMSENSKEAYSILQVLTKTQQHKSAAIEDVQQ